MMTTDEFWDIYVNSDKESDDFFTTAYTFFSNELPQDFLDECDVTEVLLEVQGHQFNAKKFDNSIAFISLIAEKYPKLYHGVFEYYDSSLIEYYCFKGEYDKAEKSFTNFLHDQDREPHIFINALQTYLFYQGQFKSLEKLALEKNDTSSYDCYQWQRLIKLEECYQKQSFDHAYFKKISTYDKEICSDWAKHIEMGMFNKVMSTEELYKVLLDNDFGFTVVLKAYFLQYMQKEKGFSFCIAGMLWDKYISIWIREIYINNRDEVEINLESIATFLYMPPKLFKSFIYSLKSDLFSYNIEEMVSIVWGGVYVYDFLYEVKYITQEAFEEFSNTIYILKGEIISAFTHELWKGNFVHSWQRPNSISEDEFREEEKIFKKSFSLLDKAFSYHIKHLKEELAAIGPLAEYIHKGAQKYKEQEKEPSLLGRLIAPEVKIKQDPIVKEETVGRNDPCPCGSGKKYKKCCM